MDFDTLMGIDALPNSSSIHGVDIFSSSTNTTSSVTDNSSVFFDSGISVEQRRSAPPQKLDWRCFKMAKTEALPPQPDQQQLLSFTSFGVPATTDYIGNGGTYAPSQRMELERQALICTYVDANATPPSDLLIPMRRSIFNPLTTESERTSAYARLCGNADAEAARCRRTDGKKWRCSRNAVAEHKYCERHLNRGRRRSRKPVDGHSRKASHLTQHQMNSHEQPITASSSSTMLNRTTFSKAKANTCQPTVLLNSKITGTEFTNPKQNQIGMSQRQVSWIPFNWDSCAGGPLAEALMNTGKTSSSWDLMMENWTPATTFRSVSDSTTSSPKHKTSGGISSVLPRDLLEKSPANPKASRYSCPLTWKVNG